MIKMLTEIEQLRVEPDQTAASSWTSAPASS
jgi:hypothetical protein